MDFVEIWMSMVGISMALAGLPQIRRLLKRKSSNDISIWAWLILINGQAWWLWYGYHLHSISLVATNVMCVIFSMTIIFLVLKYRKN
jgi:uncharacterized protein with PQ loop repeat